MQKWTKQLKFKIKVSKYFQITKMIQYQWLNSWHAIISVHLTYLKKQQRLIVDSIQLILIVLLPQLLLTLLELCVQLVSQGKAGLAGQSLRSVYPATTTMDNNTNWDIHSGFMLH